MRHRMFRGRIDYVHRRDGEFGREWFSVTVQRNGDRTLRAHCEMDDVELLRDVVQTHDAGWLPVDAFVRLTQHGRFVGSSWFNFVEDGIQCEGVTADGGWFSQWLPTDGRVRLFASHPVAADGMQCAAYDHDSSRADTDDPSLGELIASTRRRFRAHGRTGKEGHRVHGSGRGHRSCGHLRGSSLPASSVATGLDASRDLGHRPRLRVS